MPQSKARGEFDNTGANSGVQIPTAAISLADLMAGFDQLPPEYRRFVRDAPYNIGVEGLEYLSIRKLKSAIAKAVRQSIAATYGKDHPGA